MAKPADLLSVEEARGRILERFSRLESEEVALERARARFLAQPAVSRTDVPPFANSSMDGFALDSSTSADASAVNPLKLKVAFHIAAGAIGRQALGPGECARIMTGAPMPEGADAVVPFEEVDDQGDHIELPKRIASGSCVRPAGQDVRVGQTVLKAGSELQAPQIGLLAALGYPTAVVTRQPIVAVLSTGDELAGPGEVLGPGQIYESNSPMLLTAIQEAGALRVQSPPVRDDRDAIRESLERLGSVDLVLTSGGASVGDFDHVKDVIGADGEISFWRVRVRPGKPLLFGSFKRVPILGLPGNPTSAMVTFEQFARPAIRKMLGAPLMRPEIEAIADERIDNHGGRRTYARVQLQWRDGAWHARLAGGQDSAMLRTLASADGLFEISEEKEVVLPGDRGATQVWNLPPR